MRVRKELLRIGLTALAVFLLGLIQAGFFDRLKFFDCKPELVMCFVVILAARADILRAGITGFLAGFYMDVVYGRYVGIYTFLYLTVSWAASLVIGKLMEKNKWLGLAALPPLMLVYEIAESFIVRFFAVYVAGGGELYNYGYGEHFAVRILPGAAYNLLVCVLFYLIMLLFLRIRRPRPDINYRREKDIVIDNAQ